LKLEGLTEGITCTIDQKIEDKVELFRTLEVTRPAVTQSPVTHNEDHISRMRSELKEVSSKLAALAHTVSMKADMDRFTSLEQISAKMFENIDTRIGQQIDARVADVATVMDQKMKDQVRIMDQRVKDQVVMSNLELTRAPPPPLQQNRDESEQVMREISTIRSELRDLSSRLSDMSRTVATKADMDAIASIDAKVRRLDSFVAQQADRPQLGVTPGFMIPDATLDSKISEKLATHTLALASKADKTYVDSLWDEVRISKVDKADKSYVDCLWDEVRINKVDKADVDVRVDEACRNINLQVDPTRVHDLVAQPLGAVSRKVDAVEARVFRLVEVLVDGVPVTRPSASRTGGGYNYKGNYVDYKPVFDNATSDALLAVMREDPYYQWVEEPTVAIGREDPIRTQQSPLQATGRRPASVQRPLSARRTAGPRRVNVTYAPP
jgi:hypothetical protein